ncbi:hypothetical protein APC57_02940 [Acinetobacter baumannii]|nr:hypothetical protein APC57_02940 [Acinetobacter baumannii]
MKWHEIGKLNCPIAKSLSIIGDRWTLLIIRNAFAGTSRFEDFQEQLGITHHLLAERIKRLVESDIFEKKLYCDTPKRYEYKLTVKGIALQPILKSLRIWGEVWYEES